MALDWTIRSGAIGASLLLAACASAPKPAPTPGPKPSVDVDLSAIPPGGLYKVGNPYQVDGVWYYPAENYAYREEGVASWYGDDFHGKRTANGERFDMNAVSAAHPTLPMPSSVKITNLDNGRELKVRVNDRGPFKSQRVIDLSRRAAQLLGFDTAGTAHVRVEIDAQESLTMKNQALRANPGEMPKIAAAPRSVVTSTALEPPKLSDATPASQSSGKIRANPPAPAPAAKPLPPEKSIAMAAPGKPAKGKAAKGQTIPPALPPAAAGPGIYIQAGAFSDVANAHRLEQELRDFGNAFVLPVTVNNRQLYRVRLGPIPEATEADALLVKVRSYGYEDAQVVRF